MDYYKDIYRRPFRDFTLTEFEKWRNVLRNCKMNNFVDVSDREMFQIVYYYLAIKNYDGASFFLDKCNSESNQFKFLKILFRLVPENSDFFYFSTGYLNSNFNSDYMELFNLGVIGYRPAMLLIGGLHVMPAYPLEFKPTILDMLAKIIDNLLEGNIEFYFVHIVQNIRNVMLNNKPNLVVVGTGFNELSTNWARSDGDLLNILKTHRYKHSGRLGLFRHDGCSLQNLDENIIDNATSGIITLITEKIQEPDYNSIKGFVLKVYAESLSNPSPKCRILVHLINLTNECVNQLYQYIINGGENVNMMTSYLKFFLKIEGKVRFWKKHRAICKCLLLKCYSKGLLFVRFPMNYYKGIIEESFYKVWPFEKEDNLAIKEGVNNVVEFIENIFWFREIYGGTGWYLRPFDPKIDEFHFLLELSPLLWKASMCMMGINLINKKWSFSRNIFEVGKQYEQFEAKRKGFRQKPLLLINVVENMMLELIMIKYRCESELMEDVDNVKLTSLGVMLRNFKQRVVTSTDYFSMFREVLFILAQMDVFASTYRDKLDIHDKYKPNSIEYVIAKESFDEKLLIVKGSEN